MAERELVDVDELAKLAHQHLGEVRARLSRLEWERIGADVERQQTAADAFALGVFCALIALWLAARLSARLAELVPPAADDA